MEGERGLPELHEKRDAARRYARRGANGRAKVDTRIKYKEAL